MILGLGGVGFALSKSDSTPDLLATWQECTQIRERLPPAVLYSYADPRLFSSEHRAPASVIEPRFKLKPFRQGIFAAETVEDADEQASFKNSQLFLIDLKKECVQKARVSTLVKLPEQSKFKKWFNHTERNKSFEEWTELCFADDGMPKSSEFHYYETPNHTETECEKTVQEYFENNAIAIVQDHLNTQSWIIRDQSCIEKMNSDATYWAREFSQNEKIWENKCGSYKNHLVRTRAWFMALAEKAEALDPQFSLENLILEKKIKNPFEGRTDGFTIHDFAKEFDGAMKRCKEGGRLPELKEAFRTIATTDLKKVVVKKELDNTCR